MSARELLVASHMAQVAKALRRRALLSTFDGRGDAIGQAYVTHCRVLDEPTRSVVIFTRDTGHHSSGWMRNPDYERCWHLSLSEMPPVIIIPGYDRIAELDGATRNAWVRAFFREDARYTWFESAKSTAGKRRGVEHFRLFCDEHWSPITPRGEVYSSEFTEKGWRSASQVLEEDGTRIVSTVDPT